jgi:cellulose biosynthesis protein BcsQ
MTSFHPQAVWVSRLTDALQQSAPHLVREPLDLALLRQTLETPEALPMTQFDPAALLRQACALHGLPTSSEPPQPLILLTGPASLLVLTLRLLLPDLLALQTTLAPTLTWSCQTAPGVSLRLALPVSRHTLWRYYFLVGADFHCLAEWNIVVATAADAAGHAQLVFTFRQPDATAASPRSAKLLLAKYWRELQRSHQQVASFYQLRQAHLPRPVFTAIQRAELPWPLGPRFILFDALVPGVGRTTTLLNLAAVLAQDFQQNVLCLDTQTLPTSRLGCWTLPAWREADVPPDDWVYRADFHRQLLTVAERFTLAGYWGGQDECWRETLRNETAAFDLVLIECHQLSSENEMDSLLLADLVLLAAGLRADELSAAFPLTTYASLSRFQARTPPPIKLLFQQRPQAAQLRQFYQAQGADFLTQEIVSDQAYQAALQAGQPVVHCAPQSAATRSYRAVAEEILRLLYCP